MNKNYHLPDHNKGFVHTNVKTVEQRAEMIAALLPNTSSIAEICCGNCFLQSDLYRKKLKVQTFLGLDIDQRIVEMNKQQGVACMQGDALNGTTLKKFLDYDIVFFGPPLSVYCDGRQLLPFRKVTPGYFDFVELMVGKLGYKGTLVCICPVTTSMGEIQTLYHSVKTQNKDFRLGLIHHSYSDVTSRGDVTEPRLKYVELWFSVLLEENWVVQKSTPGT
jgi:hypothetical protein